MDQTIPTVFVVDDDAEVRNALKLLLESVGLPVACFASAIEYLAAFDERLPGLHHHRPRGCADGGAGGAGGGGRLHRETLS